MNRTAVIYALASAALFGVSTPAAKVLVGSINPVTLAELLYCGAGIGVAILRRMLPSIVTGAPEVSIARDELPWLAGAIAAGGVLGPLLLMCGLWRKPCSFRRCPTRPRNGAHRCILFDRTFHWQRGCNHGLG